MRNWLNKFMMGRYGPDQLTVALVAVSFVLSLLGSLTRLWLFTLLAWAALAFALYRFLSRDLEKRRSENDWFVTRWWPIRTKIVNWWREIKDLGQYKYFRCPSCKNKLRVPRGKGKIRITCPKCGQRFEKKS